MPTYTPLQSIELTSSASTVTFSNIPQNYQDLVIVGNVQLTSSGQSFLYQYNGDAGNNYSLTILKGNGSSATSDRRSNINYQLAAGWDAGLPTSTSYATGIININNYSNTTTNKTSIARGSNAAGGDVTATVCLWRNTSAINSITLYTGTGNLAAGSTFDLYGISPVAADTAQAFGGTEVYYDSTYVYHVFKGSGTFTPYRNLTCDYLVVAGGGGGGSALSNGTDGAGGGGAGGLRSTVGATGGGGSLESALSLTANTTYTVTVGAGGSGGTSDARGANGNDSVFSTITSTGGGGGGGVASGQQTGNNGGSGGGGSCFAVSAGTGTTNQGYAGGAGATNAPGGGGGAGGAGTAGVANTANGGNGGIGVQITALANATNTGANSGYYAGGGGGAADASSGTAGLGGSGGGGIGYTPTFLAGSGVTNTGSGGGGGGAPDAFSAGGNGGSGIVIVRYAR